jgi:hypothetical protein
MRFGDGWTFRVPRWKEWQNHIRKLDGIGAGPDSVLTDFHEPPFATDDAKNLDPNWTGATPREAAHLGTIGFRLVLAPR